MNKPHKWAAVIKAWADGAEVECKNIFIQGSHWGPWNEEEGPINWNDPDYIFRVKVDPTVEVKYFEKLVTLDGEVSYIEFEPDLEAWDLKITYVDGAPTSIVCLA